MPPDAIDKAINAGMKACDLYEVAAEDILKRRSVRKFLAAAIAAWLKEQAAALRDAA